ncbi:MAG: hypothetical protein CVU77_01070 [Elusimicrobia bacterium HGW-Elusimicrobia-1]|nr:MAG: hypothetical protein CVU77_01070 [Elusimicrobia bacterium HGW-Elusimicrobia-1]
MKKNIFSFDFFVVLLTLAASAYVMYSRAAYHARQSELKERYEVSRKDILKRAAVPPANASLPSIPSETGLRNILFAVKSSAAKKVSIVGDFNDWTPQGMTKDASGMWTVALKIVPGDYAYNFIVDGRPVRDFNNPKTKDTGRGFVSSSLEVKPFTPDDK